jgi:hypothetical protein
MKTECMRRNVKGKFGWQHSKLQHSWCLHLLQYILRQMKACRNVTYASQDRNDSGLPIGDSSHYGRNNVNVCGHQQHQGSGHENHGHQQHRGSGRPQHQGRGYQRRYRDNNGNYSEYHAMDRRGYYRGNRGEGDDYHN